MMTETQDAVQPLTVVLIDDDETTRNIFQMVLEHHHFELNVAVDAKAGIDYLANTPAPDIIVIDIFLPDQDGYQVLRELKKRNIGSNARFIATTSYYTTDTEEEALQRGFHGYLRKPIDSMGLIAYLNKIAQRN
jgi:CheY-like chemotaxis protein